MSYVERFSIAGKRALVTGGSKGIGAVAAVVLAEAGADIAITGRDPGDLEEVRQQVVALGRRCHVIVADLAQAEDAQRTAEDALAYFGTVDILVNNAGISRVAPLVNLAIEDWEAVMAVNLRAPFIIARALAPKMIEQGGGKIINVSSQAGSYALHEHAAYSASKGGLNMLTRTMAVEWGPHNIQSNCVSPTVILTPMGERVWGQPEKGDPMRAKIPLGRFGKPVEVADVILFLASPASDMINGDNIFVDGGYTAQ
ncbi:MAG: glucose 1-dehydrogenase [Chloroflexota bacterium]|nr:glucose 1-dehydrogenase [Chloroflexota bacterium]